MELSDLKNGGSSGRFALVMLILMALLIAALFLNLAVGSVKMSLAEIWDLIKSGRNASTESLILFNIRIPRMLLAAVLGGALAVSGFLLQSFFR